MEQELDWHAAYAALEWQIELGVTDAICDTPIDRYALEKDTPKPAGGTSRDPRQAAPQRPAAAQKKPEIDTVALAQKSAAAATSLPALRDALQGFDHCALKRGARNTVFADGQAGARVMVIGEAPGRDEDRAGRPFVGAAGQLLDKMLGAIDLRRDENVYITNVLPWRPPQNRDPNRDEIAMMVPFLKRHVELAEPEILILMGNVPCLAMLGQSGVTKLRGNWADVQAGARNCLAMPMAHPAHLLRQPAAKRDAWHDLLEIRAKLDGDDA